MHKGTKVLVTGGAGFIGSHVVDRLLSARYSVRVIDDLSTGKLSNINNHVNNGMVDFVRGDIQDPQVVQRSVSEVDVVIHLAAITSVPYSIENPSRTFETNVAGTLNLLVSCAKERVSEFVLISSCAVYGEPTELPLDEKQSANPISPYAESKLAAERFCLGFHDKHLIKSVVLRLFNVYGSRQQMNDYSGVITRFISCCKQNLPLKVYGDGSQTRDFVNVQDVVDAIQLVLENENAEGEVFNIGSGKPTSVYELASIILELSASDSRICFDQPRFGDIRDSYADISKAEELLNYKPRFSLRDGLRLLLDEKMVVK